MTVIVHGLKKRDRQDRHNFPGCAKDSLWMQWQSNVFPAGKMSQSRAVNGYPRKELADNAIATMGHVE